MALAASLLLSAVGTAVASTPLLGFSAGQAEVFDSDARRGQYGIEYRFRAVGAWDLVPAIGYTYIEKGAQFVYAELRRDFWFHQDWAISPSLGLTAFHDNDSLDLGSTFQFRSGVELAYRFANGYRLGLAVYHLSNADLADENPGTEMVKLSLSVPIGKE